MPTSRIQQLSLLNFRNIATCQLECDAPLVVLQGANGAGKTNMLEAISMLAPGRGFRNASAEEQYIRITTSPQTEQQWVVRATITNEHQTLNLATAATIRANAKRIIHIDGETAKKQRDLLNHILLLWFLPSMSHLLQEGASVRRKYIDRIVYGFDTEHASRINAYDHYMRERRKLLSGSSHDTRWLGLLEHKMAEYAVAIAASRIDSIMRLNDACTHISSEFPRAHIDINGHAELLLIEGHSALDAEDALIRMLKESRNQDSMNGRCSIGAHKTEFPILYTSKAMPAEHCSTGEQKALLLSLLLAQIYAHQQWSSRPPIVLLDEMVAHLDITRRAALFKVFRDANIQVFATGTDIADFSGAHMDEAIIFHIDNGAITHENQAIYPPVFT